LLLLPLPLLCFCLFGLSSPQGICCYTRPVNSPSATSQTALPFAMPPREYRFWIYILSSRSRNLYVGITNDLLRRTTTHRRQFSNTHTGHYRIHRLVHYEYFQYIDKAIAREKELKRWTRQQKIQLIEKTNPTWEDLYPKLLQPTPTPRFGSEE